MRAGTGVSRCPLCVRALFIGYSLVCCISIGNLPYKIFQSQSWRKKFSITVPDVVYITSLMLWESEPLVDQSVSIWYTTVLSDLNLLFVMLFAANQHTETSPRVVIFVPEHFRDSSTGCSPSHFCFFSNLSLPQSLGHTTQHVAQRLDNHLRTVRVPIRSEELGFLGCFWLNEKNFRLNRI